jgi:protoporphyrinogen oxidase
MSTDLTRRDALVTLLGAPLAAAACRRPIEGAYDGRIVGQDVSHGHALRGAPIVESRWREAPSTRARVVVVGAGPAGLSCAWSLSKTLRGPGDVTILELEPEPGGTSLAGHDSVSDFPWGAHYVPSPGAHNAPFCALLREMGITEVDREGRARVREELLVRDLDERLWFQGQWREGLFPAEGAGEDDLRQWRALQAEVDRWVRWRDPDGRRAFVLPSTLASDAPEVVTLDRITMSQWMNDRGFTSPRVRWMVDYACRDDYGLRAEQTSAWAGLFYFASRVQTAGGSAEELIAFPEGNGRFARWFSAQLGPRVRTSTLVRAVLPREDGAVEVRATDVRTGAPTRYLAEYVVLAVPRFIARRLLPSGMASEPAVAAPLTYSPWLVANLHLRARPRLDPGGLEMAWDNVLHDSPALGYVCATHQSLRDHGPTILTWYLPMCGPDPDVDRRALLSMDWRACADAAVSDLSRAHPDLPSLLTRVDVMRWGHAMARPVPGFLAKRAPAEPGSGDRRVLFAHTDRSGIALLEEAFDRGIRAADGVLADLRRAPAEPVGS